MSAENNRILDYGSIEASHHQNHHHYHYHHSPAPNSNKGTNPVQEEGSSEEWKNSQVLSSLKSNGNEFPQEESSISIKLAVNASWAVNWFLLGAKIFAVIVSSSKAVTASLADSFVDLASQAILSIANRYIARHSPNYPVGRSRLEALSVIGCAFIMCMASIEVIQYSCVDLYNGINGDIPYLNVDADLYIILGLGIALKFLLWIFCLRLNAQKKSDTVAALAEDHFNDVISNAAAVVTAAIAFNTTAWWVDPVGAVLISLVIIYRWGEIIHEQVKKIVGHTAPPEFIEEIEKLALEHDERIEVDCTRVYHFGARYNVEMEIVLPGHLTVVESHDLALELQHKIERIEDVERAFVHVDHKRRDGLEHKVERELVKNARLEQDNPTASLLGIELRSRSVKSPIAENI